MQEATRCSELGWADITINGFFGSCMVRDVRSHPVIPSLGTAVAQLKK